MISRRRARTGCISGPPPSLEPASGCTPAFRTEIDHSSVNGFHRQDNALVCDGVPLDRPCRRRGHAALRLQRRHHRRALPGHRRRVPVVSARAALRAQGEFDAGDRPPAPGARQRRGRELGRRDRRRAPGRFHPRADRLHRRRQDRGGAGAGDRPRRQDHQRRVGRRARAHRRPGARRGRRARASRCGSTPTSTPAAIRTSPPGLKANKFGIALDAVRDICRRAVRRDGLEIVGLHTHLGSQITDLDPLRRAAEAIVSLARELRDDGIVHRSPGSRRRPRRVVRRLAGAERRRLRGGAAPRGQGVRAGDRARAGPPHRRARRRAAVAGRGREGSARTARCS